MTISSYPHGFKNGISLRGLPVAMTHPGKVFWVNNSGVLPEDGIAGSNGNDGTYLRPFLTIHYASSRCLANRGDMIVVMPGHVETVSAAAGLVLDKAGVLVLGLGSGSKRPQINFTTAVTADMDIDAANITLVNLLFTGGFDNLTGPIDINAADVSLINCETRDVTGQAANFIITDANANRLYLENWTHRGDAAAGAVSAINIIGGDGITISNFWIDGNFSTAAIRNTTTATTNLTIAGGNGQSYARTRNAADVIVTVLSTSTGNIGPNINARIQDNAANITEAFVGVAMQFFNPIRIVNADGESSLETNITQSVDA